MGCRTSTIALLFICIIYLSSGFSTPALMHNHRNNHIQHSKQSSLSSFSTKRTFTERCISRSMLITLTTTPRMTSDDKEGENIEQIDTSISSGETLADDTTSSDDVSTKTTTNNALDNISINGNHTPNTNKKVDNNNKGFSLILIPTLLFKFTIVLLVKFATDIVVFPLLWLYRLARLVKRKFIRGLKKVFGKSGSGKNGDIKEVVKVNGDSTSSSA